MLLDQLQLQKMNRQKSRKKRPLNTYARYSGIAFQMIAIILVGTFVGVKLDEKFPNTHNGYTISLTLISVVISMVYVIRRVIKASKK